MNVQQLAVLNALVTYAAENVPGGLSDDEQEVARIVGNWALTGVAKTYVPVFAGKTSDYKKIVIYKDVGSPEELHIQLDDGDLQALGPDYKMTTWGELDNIFVYLKIESPQWSGKAKGSKVELLLEAETR